MSLRPKCASRPDMAQIEEWRPCPDYEGYYEVSDLGRVRNVNGHVLTPGSDWSGYPFVGLTKDGKRTSKTVHRLVARAFHADKMNPLHKEVAHLDGTRTNCRADNLKWASRRENLFHKRAHGTHPEGRKNPRAKLTVQQVREIRAVKGWRINERLARKYGVCASTIDRVRRGKIWRTA